LAGKLHVTGPSINVEVEPPEIAVVAVFETDKRLVPPVVKFPLVSVKVPETPTAPDRVTPALLLIVRLLKVDAGIVCPEEPSKITVPPHVFPEEIGDAETLCVLIVPALVTFVTARLFVTILKLPPVVVVKVPFTVRLPPAVSVPPVLPNVRLLYAGVA
jgi:hypothetical protein